MFPPPGKILGVRRRWGIQSLSATVCVRCCFVACVCGPLVCCSVVGLLLSGCLAMAARSFQFAGGKPKSSRGVCAAKRLGDEHADMKALWPVVGRIATTPYVSAIISGHAGHVFFVEAPPGEVFADTREGREEPCSGTSLHAGRSRPLECEIGDTRLVQLVGQRCLGQGIAQELAGRTWKRACLRGGGRVSEAEVFGEMSRCRGR